MRHDFNFNVKRSTLRGDDWSSQHLITSTQLLDHIIHTAKFCPIEMRSHILWRFSFDLYIDFIINEFLNYVSKSNESQFKQFWSYMIILCSMQAPVMVFMVKHSSMDNCQCTVLQRQIHAYYLTKLIHCSIRESQSEVISWS